MKALPAARRQVRLKNHVTPKGRALNSQLSSMFGIDLNMFRNACMGDLGAIQKIGELNKQAGFMKEYAPKLKDAYLQIIEGSTIYNLALADILKAAGNASLQIKKAANSTALADRKFVNQTVEIAQQYKLDKQNENARHEYQLNYQQVKGYLDAFLISVDREAAILDQSNRPDVKQIEADKQRQNKVVDEYLLNGNDARVDLIPQKNYVGIKGKFQEFKAALGF